MRHLVDLDVEHAKREKDALGKQKYGPEWQGDPPSVEGYVDNIDCLNYLDYAEAREPKVAQVPELLEWMRAAHRELAEAWRFLAKLPEPGAPVCTCAVHGPRLWAQDRVDQAEVREAVAGEGEPEPVLAAAE